MEEDQIKFFKDLVDGLKKQDDLFQQLGKINTWMRDCIGVALGRYAERSEQSESWQSSQNSNLPVGSNRTFDFQEADLKNLRLRKDGRYEFRKMIKGVNYQCIDKNKKVVLDYIADLKRKMKSLLPNTKQNANISFCDYADDYYHLFKENKASASSRAEWNTALKLFREKLNRSFRSYAAFDFQKLINEIAEIAPNTAKKTYNKIRAICRKAFLSGIIKTNIAEIIEKPEFEEKPRRALTILEQVKFLNQLKHEEEDIQIFCLFCLITSARREEARKYKPSDFNKRNMTLFVNGTKTLNAPRTIRVTSEFADLLQKVGKGFKYTSDHYSRVAKGIFEKIGSPDLVLNCLRHTCATNMVYLGISSDYRKHIMGHSTVLTTDRVYTHIEMGVTKARMQLIYKNLYFTDY